MRFFIVVVAGVLLPTLLDNGSGEVGRKGVEASFPNRLASPPNPAAGGLATSGNVNLGEPRGEALLSKDVPEVDATPDLSYLCPDVNVLTRECIAELDRRYLDEPVTLFKGGRGPGASPPGLLASALAELLAADPLDAPSAGQTLADEDCRPPGGTIRSIPRCDAAALGRSATLTRVCADPALPSLQSGRVTESQTAFWAREQLQQEGAVRASWMRIKCRAVTIVSGTLPSELSSE